MNIEFYVHINSTAWADENQLKYEKVFFFSGDWVKLTQDELFSIFKSVCAKQITKESKQQVFIQMI